MINHIYKIIILLLFISSIYVPIYSNKTKIIINNKHLPRKKLLPIIDIDISTKFPQQNVDNNTILNINNYDTCYFGRLGQLKILNHSEAIIISIGLFILIITITNFINQKYDYIFDLFMSKKGIQLHETHEECLDDMEKGVLPIYGKDNLWENIYYKDNCNNV
jgi:hypothetical protein